MDLYLPTCVRHPIWELPLILNQSQSKCLLWPLIYRADTFLSVYRLILSGQYAHVQPMRMDEHAGVTFMKRNAS